MHFLAGLQSAKTFGFSPDSCICFPNYPPNYLANAINRCALPLRGRTHFTTRLDQALIPMRCGPARTLIAQPNLSLGDVQIIHRGSQPVSSVVKKDCARCHVRSANVCGWLQIVLFLLASTRATSGHWTSNSIHILRVKRKNEQSSHVNTDPEVGELQALTLRAYSRGSREPRRQNAKGKARGYKKWARPDSNRRHLRCKRSALTN